MLKKLTYIAAYCTAYTVLSVVAWIAEYDV